MNEYVTGAVIKELREKHHLTQAELANMLNVSDKTVSKWETAKGYPDISLLEPIARVFGISVTELISGNAIQNVNTSGNMMRSKFYVCPVCGNIMHCMGEAVIQCHGVQLMPCQEEEIDEKHSMSIEMIEDEYFVRVEHEMTKSHYISFIAAVCVDKIHMIKLYPEGNAEGRFPIRGVRKMLVSCNQDGLFGCNVKR
ncbi:MAG: helix-turn-helix domain-containing protein [Lachnospiraceae bacterium]|nr:helix-turn-helix domain-containing protein [Lachnospiraceae bacterium]